MFHFDTAITDCLIASRINKMAEVFFARHNIQAKRSITSTKKAKLIACAAYHGDTTSY